MDILENNINIKHYKKKFTQKLTHKSNTDTIYKQTMEMY